MCEYFTISDVKFIKMSFCQYLFGNYPNFDSYILFISLYESHRVNREDWWKKSEAAFQLAGDETSLQRVENLFVLH